MTILLRSEPATHVVDLKINRPQRMNALSRDLIDELANQLNQIEQDPDIRVVVIRGAGRAFCAGADLKERATMEPPQVEQFVTGLRSTFSFLHQMSKVTVAVIQGAALGGGLELALHCDLRYAAEDAKLGLTETRLAIIPGAGGTQMLPRIVGTARAKHMIFTAQPLSGARAAEIGLVHAAVPATDLDEWAKQQVNQIVGNGPIALRLAKRAIDAGIQVSLDQGLEIEKTCYAQVIPTQDRLEGLLAFNEKRAPKYSGR